MRIIEIDAADTHALRRAVLRNGDPSRSVEFPEDELHGVFHLAVIDTDGVLVATSSWIPRTCPELPGPRAVQLRGMATAAALQGTGVGGLLLETAVERCVEDGFELMWARARDSALRFYVKHGCTVSGEGFIDATTALPHHIVVRDLRPGRLRAADRPRRFPSVPARSTQADETTMPPAPTPPDHLRRRAAQLRATAAAVSRCQALELSRRATDDAWLGPTPRLCHDDLVAVRCLLLEVVDELRDRAALLEARANALEAAG